MQSVDGTFHRNNGDRIDTRADNLPKKNKLWFEYRYGRVSASKMHRVMAQVVDDTKLKSKHEDRFLSPAENLVANVLGYKVIPFKSNQLGDSK